jgi:site-specific DNA-methyltransferase (adenine-specific)
LNARRFIASDERLFQFKKPKAWHNYGWTTVWRMHVTSSEFDHPCPFPIDLPKRCIASCTEVGDLVLDPYGGAGTTAIAAKALRRRSLSIEIEERYCSIIAERLESADSSPQLESPAGERLALL